MTHSERRESVLIALLTLNDSRFLKGTIENIADPRVYINKGISIEEVVNYLNELLIFDGYKLQEKDLRYKVVKVKTTQKNKPKSKSAEGGNPSYPIPEELNKWAKEVVRILLKKGIMKHGDLLSELESIKSYNCTYLHISQLFQNAFSKKFLKKEITNKNSYYSLTDPDKYTL
jgi:hypothetical protein